MGDLSVKLEKLTINNNNTEDGGGDKFAVKTKTFLSISDAEMSKKEVKILNRLKHDFIVAYLDHFKNSKGQLAIVMLQRNSGGLRVFLSSQAISRVLCLEAGQSDAGQRPQQE